MRIGFLITARLKSSRLPMKLLLDVFGKRLVERVIERSKLVIGIDEIVLCTSQNPQDKPLADVALENKIHYFLGDEMDVVKRLSDAATFFGLDYIINITGENPLFSIYHANLMINKIKIENPDFTYISGLPIGCAVYGIKANALKIVCEVKKEIDTEIWGALINQPEYFKVAQIKAASEFEHVRITADYKEDYSLIRKIYELQGGGASIPDFADVESLLKENSQILHINSMHKQFGLSEEKLEEIRDHYRNNSSRIAELKRYYNLD